MAITGNYATNDAVSFKDCEVEVDLEANDSWASIDTWATEVSVDGGEVPTTQTYPFRGNVIVFTGNKPQRRATVTCVYTEGSTDPFRNIYDRYNDNDGPNMDIRYSPKGSGEGGLLFTTGGGKLVMATPPQGAGDASTPTTFQFIVEFESLTIGTES